MTPLRSLRLIWLVALLAPSVLARAEVCSTDAVPAATLLLPYFEVDVTNPNGVTTLFSVNNAAAEATLAHVTLWTDYDRPTLNFDVYLTGYDVQTFNLRDVLRGSLPATAIASQDPEDTISPRGVLSQDIDFPGCPIVNILPPVLGDELIRAHQGLEAPGFGGCVAYPHGDGLARGYVTVDTVSRCSVSSPADADYFATVAVARNVLWGSYFQVDPANHSAQQETLVHVEACVPSATESCFASNDYTFYGRFGTHAVDQREPLPSTFALAYLEGGAFVGGTRLAVWRDTKRPPAPSGRCGFPPSWYPLHEGQVASFDEQEHAADHCVGSQADPPLPTAGCFPLATQLVRLGEASVSGADVLAPPTDFGWLFLNLTDGFSGDPFPGRSQAWVTTVLTASDRFSVSSDAIALDDLCSAAAGQGTVF